MWELDRYNFMAAIPICSDFGAPQNKVSHCFHCFPFYLPWSDGTACHDLLNVDCRYHHKLRKIKKAEHRRTDYFELWYWRRLLRVSWTVRRSNQSILKEIGPGCSLEGPMLKWNSTTLATWCEKLTHLERSWCWERLKAGGEGNDLEWDGWMASLTQWTWVWVNCGSWWWTGRPDVLQSKGSQRVRHAWVTELNWNELQLLGVVS